MLPNSEGVWRWKRNDDGREFDLPVYNRGTEFGVSQHLNILWLKTWMDLKDFIHGKWIAHVSHNPENRVTQQIQGWIHPEDWD
jgi:hypothetical protein